MKGGRRECSSSSLLDVSTPVETTAASSLESATDLEYQLCSCHIMIQLRWRVSHAEETMSWKRVVLLILNVWEWWAVMRLSQALGILSVSVVFCRCGQVHAGTTGIAGRTVDICIPIPVLRSLRTRRSLPDQKHSEKRVQWSFASSGRFHTGT